MAAVVDPVAGFFNELTYRSYRFNRERSPEIKPESWRHLFGSEVDEYEARYQDEANAAGNVLYKRDQEEPQWLRNARTGARDE